MVVRTTVLNPHSGLSPEARTATSPDCCATNPARSGPVPLFGVRVPSPGDPGATESVQDLAEFVSAVSVAASPTLITAGDAAKGFGVAEGPG